MYIYIFIYIYMYIYISVSSPEASNGQQRPFVFKEATVAATACNRCRQPLWTNLSPTSRIPVLKEERPRESMDQQYIYIYIYIVYIQVYIIHIVYINPKLDSEMVDGVYIILYICIYIYIYIYIYVYIYIYIYTYI